MSENIILRTRNLRREFKNFVGVESLNMRVEKGDIYGFIGLNGAGKTTSIRMVTSLIKKTSGDIELFGKTSKNDLTESRKKIGCIIETPVMNDNLSAYENMEYYRILKGISDKNRTIEVLKLVDLYNTGNKKFKNFSLGMKQRLGIALAMLGKPELLILDEPLNGLDPMGIIEIRDLIISLNKESDITIIISSHILSELYQVATRYGIMHKGKIIKEISKEDLDKECKKNNENLESYFVNLMKREN